MSSGWINTIFLILGIVLGYLFRWGLELKNQTNLNFEGGYKNDL